MVDETPPVLPATPWYESEVQVRAVVALAFQAISIFARYVPMPWLANHMDQVVADVSQIVAIAFGVLAITKRQQSSIQPLTLTRAGAETKNAANPAQGAP